MNERLESESDPDPVKLTQIHAQQTLWEMGMQEKVINGFTYIMQRKIPWNDDGKTVSQHITKFSVLLLSAFQCQILKICTYSTYKTEKLVKLHGKLSFITFCTRIMVHFFYSELLYEQGTKVQSD
jgi:hypothetical protein